MNELIDTHFPYCLLQLDDGTWAILNREYRAVGHSPAQAVASFDDLPPAIRIRRISPQRIAKLSCTGKIDGKYIYLYNDSCTPTDGPKAAAGYLERLAQLFDLKTAK